MQSLISGGKQAPIGKIEGFLGEITATHINPLRNNKENACVAQAAV